MLHYRSLFRFIFASLFFLLSNIALALYHSMPYPTTSYQITATRQSDSTKLDPLILSNQINTPISAIIVNGNIQLRIRMLKSHQRNFYRINQSQVSLVQTVRSGSTFVIQPATSCKGRPLIPPALIAAPIPVTLGIKQLNLLVLNGTSSVYASRLIAPNLHIITNTTGEIALHGKVGLQELVTNGAGTINIQGVNTASLRVINHGIADIHLAGVVKQLQAELTSQGRLEAEALIANTVFIKACGQSQARINVINFLNAFAYDQGFILYWGNPGRVTEYSTNSGNILRMN